MDPLLKYHLPRRYVVELSPRSEPIVYFTSVERHAGSRASSEPIVYFTFVERHVERHPRERANSVLHNDSNTPVHADV